MEITILGCGASAGVPLIGCSCPVCLSSNPKNKRSRSSILIEKAGERVLVDVSPDIRQQALANHFSSVDAIFMTHAHADHCHGIDDVRSFNYHKDQVIDLYSDESTLTELHERFAYAFQAPIAEYGWFRPALRSHLIDPKDTTPIQLTPHIEAVVFSQQHGSDSQTMGLRIGNVAYSTDVNFFSDSALKNLKNLDLWIVDCLRYQPAPTHAHLALTLSWIEKLRPKRAILTHMGHDFDYERLKAELPPNVEPAYDGMSVICPDY